MEGDQDGDHPRRAAPERLQAAPYQVKSIAVRDACLAVRRCKQANKELAAAKNAGQRLDESFAVVKFRSRKHPRQGFQLFAKI